MPRGTGCEVEQIVWNQGLEEEVGSAGSKQAHQPLFLQEPWNQTKPMVFQTTQSPSPTPPSPPPPRTGEM